MGLFVFSQVAAVGPSTLLRFALFKLVACCLKAASTRGGKKLKYANNVMTWEMETIELCNPNNKQKRIIEKIMKSLRDL